jgi:predicted DNA-binding protein
MKEKKMPKGKNEKLSKSKSAKKKSSDYVYVSVRVSPELKKAVKKEALRRGETKSAIVREALEKYLKSA